MPVIRERASSWSDGRIFNAQVMIDSNGNIFGCYRKTHLFAPAPVEEHKYFAAGAELVTQARGELRAGLSICYDLRFPQIYRALALDGGRKYFRHFISLASLAP